MTFFWLLVAVVFIALLYRFIVEPYFGAKASEDLPEGSPYHVYTEQFDTQLNAAEYPQFLEARSKPNTAYVSDSIDSRFGGVGEWEALVDQSTELFNKMSGQWASFVAELDALQNHSQGKAITLLVDQSGSLRGEKILHLATSIRWLCGEFEKRGMTFEVLGFTTTM